jgi:hypothetical protein
MQIRGSEVEVLALTIYMDGPSGDVRETRARSLACSSSSPLTLVYPKAI